jgi:two-component system, cell cycle sensor histidine kinase and response regulator CckA
MPRSISPVTTTEAATLVPIVRGTPSQEDDERLRQAIRAGNIGIFEHDHETDVLYWSPELREMYGWDLEEHCSLPKIVSHVHPEDLERVVAAVRWAHDPAGDGAFDIEHRILDRRGRLRWVLTRSRTHFGSVSGQARPIRTIGAVQDVTDRHVAEERLRVLDTVLSSSAQAIAIADSNGVLTFANAALRRLWGYSDGEELLGRSMFELWKTDEPPVAALERVREQRLITLEMLAARVDGSPFHLGIAAEAVCDTRGALTQLLVTFTDVTDRKRLEAQLVHAQKMESIGRLAGGVAHDFNNLLTVICGGLELGLKRLALEHPSRTYLADVSEAARSAVALTRQLLAFSRKELIAPKVLDLNEVIGRVRNMILRLLGENIRLETRLGRHLTPICFDPGQMEQILLNLAVNARDAMPNGGQLTIETSNIELDANYALEHVDARPGAYALLAVSDDGAGMSEEVRAHLFEPFFTTKGAGKGTGLGLAMVYGAVRQNGGYVAVDSALSRGTTFKIHLPAATGASQSDDERTPLKIATGSASVLLVEDDDKVRALTRRILQGFGYTLHDFANGEEALAALASLRPTPELLISDVIMPGINGRVLAERVLALLPGIRVLFVSGYTQDVIAEQGVLKPGIEFLAKPYSIEQLAHRVHQILSGSA